VGRGTLLPVGRGAPQHSTALGAYGTSSLVPVELDPKSVHPQDKFLGMPLLLKALAASRHNSKQ